MKQDCHLKIKEIYKRGEKDLTYYLNTNLFPTIIEPQLKEKLSLCEEHTNAESDELYSEAFLNSFENSIVFETCQSNLKGMIKWHDWGKCEKLCSDDLDCGMQTRSKDKCLPSYAKCTDQITQTRKCKCNKCGKGWFL